MGPYTMAQLMTLWGKKDGMVVSQRLRSHSIGQVTYEDLRGRRAEGYVRDSKIDQRDGYGPELQRRAIQAFADSHGVVLGDAWYTDFITGRSTLKRSAFHDAIKDAESDRYDVLLVYHTSRFARNRADAIRYKTRLQNLAKVVVFVSQGIISGNDDDFLTEGISEVLDEHYSRNHRQAYLPSQPARRGGD
ncbi:MAG: recombinase family protein [Dehalococcoidia bacterium]